MDLPVPPSVNGLFAGKSRRYKSAAYKAWLQHAGLEINQQKVPPVSGPYNLTLQLSIKDRADVDNRTKPVLDLLVKHRLTPDDRLCHRASAERSEEVLPGRCRIMVEAR